MRLGFYLFQHGLFTCMHKYYSVEEWINFSRESPDCLKNVAASSGVSDADFKRLKDILEAIPGITFICLDVANGYSQCFVEYVRRVRAAFPSHTIIVSFRTIFSFIIYLFLFRTQDYLQWLYIDHRQKLGIL